MNRKGFTLIELLIVVAIIAILAAIAVPNFLEAQVRSKIARVKSDLRTVGVAIEAYTVDTNRAPLDFMDWWYVVGVQMNARQGCYRSLTSPIAYLSSMSEDPFAKYVKDIDPNTDRSELKYYYYNHFYQSNAAGIANSSGMVSFNARRKFAKDRGFTWAIYSVGPNAQEKAPWVPDMCGGPGTTNKVSTAEAVARIYDPSNGTLSAGRIHRTNKGEMSGDQVPRT